MMSRLFIAPPRRSRAQATGPRCKSTTRPARTRRLAAASGGIINGGDDGSRIKGQERAGDRGEQKGIGLAIAELFAAEGANVAICARNAEEVGKVVKALTAKGVKSWGRALDVADAGALKQWVDDAAGELSGIDTIVCNVSALAVGDTADTWEKSFRTDMMHTVNSVAAALPYLEKSKSASIVIVSSVSGFEVDFAAGSYGAF